MINKIDFIHEDYANITNQSLTHIASLKDNFVVITGGTGFVGVWLSGLIAFLNDNFKFNTQLMLIARNTNSFRKKYPHLSKRNDIIFVDNDVRYLTELPSDTNWLIHAAGTPDNRFHSTSPLETMSIISLGTYSILRAIERCSNFKMLLHISSGLVYGSQPMDLPMLNESFLGAPKCATVSAAYAEAKRFAETLCHSSRSQYRLPIVTARPFAFMGPFQSLERPWAINNFISDALLGNTIRVLGDGETIRSYMYASDMAFWLLTILTAGKTGQVFNVGSYVPINLSNLAKMIIEHMDNLFGINIKMNIAVSNQMQTSRFIPDVSLAQREFGLKMTVDLSTALKRTLQWNKLVYENAQ